ncbi:MAG: hypothetical protein L0332_27905 [Chloroflexi bacterium]|nr:hypothetical protein [Chloroflexota bacterium]MCI0574648.1 hypothetical protein [Chloroflexota bacterium]MCI0649070.1 hypothetical protein [Chloroflexota bacterium]MCI0730525.1 hypothetical protein [Chloroflexota bacterium]
MQLTAHVISFPVRFKIARSYILYSHHVVVTTASSTFLGAGSGVLYRSMGWRVWQLWHGWLRQRLAALTPDNLQRGWQPLLEEIIPVEPGLAFAVDAALWDLKGQMEGQPAAAMLGGICRTTIPITEQIFIADWAQSREELRQIMARGTRQVKVKIGFGVRQDVALVRRVRDFVSRDVELRVDANRAYTFSESAGLYRQLAELGILAVEEPLREPWPVLRQFRQAIGLPVMLDESILTLDDLRQAIDARAIDSLNIKLTRTGGLSQALLYRRLCQEAGLAVSLGCNEDLGPGMAAILHFSAATSHLYATEGLGNLRLGLDLVREPAVIQDGEVALPAGPGLGVHLSPDWPQQLAGRTTAFDLDQGPAGRLRAFSAAARLRQRAANALFRAGRL